MLSYPKYLYERIYNIMKYVYIDKYMYIKMISKNVNKVTKNN